jgi:hypothetical protein
MLFSLHLDLFYSHELLNKIDVLLGATIFFSLFKQRTIEFIEV